MMIQGLPLKSVDAISALVQRQTMAIPELKANMAAMRPAHRDRVYKVVERGMEIQGLYAAQLTAMSRTVQFLMECRPERYNGGWIGIKDGLQLHPPPEVAFCLDTVQAILDTQNRGVPR
jgi:hypothetical protein